MMNKTLDTLYTARAYVVESYHDDKRVRQDVLEQIEEAIIAAGGTVEPVRDEPADDDDAWSGGFADNH